MGGQTYRSKVFEYANWRSVFGCIVCLIGLDHTNWLSESVLFIQWSLCMSLDPSVLFALSGFCVSKLLCAMISIKPRGDWIITLFICASLRC